LSNQSYCQPLEGQNDTNCFVYRIIDEELFLSKNIENIAEPNNQTRTYFKSIIILKVLIFFNILLEIIVSLQMIAHYDEILPKSKLTLSPSRVTVKKDDGVVKKLLTPFATHVLNE